MPNMRETKEETYYRKAFENARRCLKEAREQAHAYGKRVIKIKDPKSGVLTEVMAINSAITWCIHFHVPTWASSTWRMTRSGYRLLLDSNIDSTITKEARVKLEDKMASTKGLPKSQRPKRTSGLRKKNITEEQLNQIIDCANALNGAWSEALVFWLKSSVITGLRPNEWQDSELIKDSERVILRSPNFKYNEKRSYAPFRDIDLTGIDDYWMSAILGHMRYVKGMKKHGESERHYNGCSYLLNRINKRLWPRRKANITLYTGRHQFSSNAKADPDVSEKERAALMGHKTTKTSRERYGKKRSGSKGLTPDIANKAVLDLIQDPANKSHPRKPGTPINNEKPVNPSPLTTSDKRNA
jgi:integrase